MQASFDLNDHPHRRQNILTGDWIIVSPHRMKRPWQGQVETPPLEERLPYDPECYLCPGNKRVGGISNPAYTSTYVFDNDFMSLLPDTPPGGGGDHTLFVAEPERGLTRVLCFAPRHDLTLARMSVAEIEPVVSAWVEQTVTLGAIPWVNYVLLFENRGAMMGASNPHPHGQVWATEHLPNEPGKELQSQNRYWARQGRCLLCDYVEQELVRGERIVCQNDHWVVLVPFWATWPFETMVLPKRHIGALPQASPAERAALADIVSQVSTRYDNLFQTSFSYSMGWHQSPTDNREYPAWHLHAHYYPPLLRSATVRKFMVGFELLGSPQRDLTPEQAAARLQALPAVHYLDGS